MFSPIGGIPISGTSYPGNTGSATSGPSSSSGAGSSSSSGQTTQAPSSSTSAHDGGTATQAEGSFTAHALSAATPSAATKAVTTPSASMARLLLDALAEMADTISSGLPAHPGQPSAASSSASRGGAELMLARTVDSYFDS